MIQKEFKKWNQDEREELSFEEYLKIVRQNIEDRIRKDTEEELLKEKVGDEKMKNDDLIKRIVNQISEMKGEIFNE